MLQCYIRKEMSFIIVDHTINSACGQKQGCKVGCQSCSFNGHIYIYYGGPEGSLPIAFLFKRFLCLSDLFLRFVSAISLRRFISSICFSDFISLIYFG